LTIPHAVTIPRDGAVVRGWLWWWDIIMDFWVLVTILTFGKIKTYDFDAYTA
jgi:hypothetical protein